MRPRFGRGGRRGCRAPPCGLVGSSRPLWGGGGGGTIWRNLELSGPNLGPAGPAQPKLGGADPYPRPPPTTHPPKWPCRCLARSTTKATKGEGSAVRRPLGRLPEVLDFGIFTPSNFAHGAQWSQKGPQIGPKIGFGAQKKTDTPIDVLNQLDIFLVNFIFHLDTTKIGLQKGL